MGVTPFTSWCYESWHCNVSWQQIKNILTAQATATTTGRHLWHLVYVGSSLNRCGSKVKFDSCVAHPKMRFELKKLWTRAIDEKRFIVSFNARVCSCAHVAVYVCALLLHLQRAGGKREWKNAVNPMLKHCITALLNITLNLLKYSKLKWNFKYLLYFKKYIIKKINTIQNLYIIYYIVYNFNPGSS